jgi:hypothetical protein
VRAAWFGTPPKGIGGANPDYYYCPLIVSMGGSIKHQFRGGLKINLKITKWDDEDIILTQNWTKNITVLCTLPMIRFLFKPL